MVTSQNDWPGLAQSSTRLYTWVVPVVDGDPIRLRLRNGSAGFLLADLALWFDAKVEDANGRILDDWGYAFRPIRGYVKLSNHASGTAMDLNATQHPLGRRDTFDADQERLIRRRLANRYDGAIRWGGDYRNRADEMHFEVDASLAVCERLARELMDTPRGRRLLAANPTQRAVILS